MLGDTQTLDCSQFPSPPAGKEGNDALARGTRLGRYVILSPIGFGGMGRIYSAFDPELERKVALKILRRRAAHGSRGARVRLQREAQAIARLTHPNVVTIFDVQLETEPNFLAMELIEGPTLDQWLAEHPRSWRRIVEVFVEAGRGLVAAHRAGIAHRDFKPSNVMLANDGRVKVLDFGLSRAAPDGGGSESEDLAASPLERRLTDPGVTVGTPAYMAPERFRADDAGPLADQFGFCVALYEALFGKLPFAGETLAELRQNAEGGHLREAPARFRIPAWLLRLVRRGLEANPAARFPSMEVLLEALEAGLKRRWLRDLPAWGAAAMAVCLPLAFTLETEKGPYRPEDLQQLNSVAERLEEVWNEQSRAELRTLFAGAEDLEDLEEGVDSYTWSWRSTLDEAFEATYKRGEQSQEDFARQVVCLDSRLQELDAFLSLAGQQISGTPRLLIGHLPSPVGCLDRQALSALAPPPEPAEASAVQALRAELAQVRLLLDSGSRDRALAVAEQAERVARHSQYRPIRGEALLHLARARGRVEGPSKMIELLLETVAQAHETGDGYLLAYSMTYLIQAHGEKGDSTAAHQWARLAEAAIRRLGSPPRLEAQRLYHYGLTYSFLDGDLATGAELIAQSIELAPTETAIKRSVQLTNLGTLYNALDRPDKALEVLRRVELPGQAPNGVHPGFHIYLCAHGDALRLSRQEGAIDYYRRCLERRQELYGEDAQATAAAMSRLGQVQEQQGYFREARLTLLDAAAIYARAEVIRPTWAPAALDLAELLWTHDLDRPVAEALVRNARAGLVVEEHPELTAQLDDWLARRIG